MLQAVRKSPKPRAMIGVRLDIEVFEAISELAARNGTRLSIQARELLTEAVRSGLAETQEGGDHA